MHPATVVALGYRYPTPSSGEALRTAVADLRGAVRRHLDDFVAAVGELSLAEWEELHTVTLDLSPKFVPYVGHVAWGENYRRGSFMATLKADMEGHDIDLGGELPDHIEPILRYVAEVAEPLEELTGVLAGAVTTMGETLHEADPDNPYRHLLAATSAAVEELAPRGIRSRGRRLNVVRSGS